VTTPGTMTQIDTALHAIRARLRDLEARPPGSGSSSSMRLSDGTPLKNNGTGSAGDEDAAARGNHVHPQVAWLDIADRPDLTGSGTDRTFRHVQTIATKVWIVSHMLDKYVAVSVVDSSGALVIGDLVYVSRNQIRLTFSAAISGEAYCN